MGRLALWVPVTDDPDVVATRLAGAPPTWLPGEAGDRGPGHWSVELTAGPIVRTATCMVGDPAVTGGVLRRRLTWTADPEPAGEPDGGPLERALPSFDGDLEVRVVEGRGELHLAGVWSVPEGTIGAVMGPAGSQQLAEAVGRGFLEAVAARVAPQPER